MSRHVWAVITILGLVLLFAGTTMAEVPHVITYQGRLTNLGGTPFTGAKLVKFTIYSGGGSPVWTSGFTTIEFTEGLFTVKLGALPQPALPLSVFSSDTAVTLGITVDVDPEITPRTRFAPSAYAVQSRYADIAAGWLVDGPKMRQIDTTLDVVIGPVGITGEKLQVSGGSNVAARFTSRYASTHGGAISAESEDDGGVCVYSLLSGNGSIAVPTTPAAIFGGCMGEEDGHAGHFFANGTSGGLLGYASGTGVGVETYSDSGYALYAKVGGKGDYTGYFDGGKGIYVVADSLTAGKFEASRLSSGTHVVDAQFIGTGAADAIGVYGKSVPSAGYGYGGYFDGGYRGVSGRAVQSTADKAYYGVYGYASSGGASTTKYGLYGLAAGGAGTNYAVYGSASGTGATNYAGYFSGNVNVTGTLSKGAGAFRIDHPLDPENKYLQHSFVESPDMKNIYDGVVTLDNDGRATVTLPDWFGTLNGDFRYQLTAIGAPGPNLHVASEISGNQFSIAGGGVGMKVSWQVTGIRYDAFANAHRIEVEVAKTADERGLYLHAEELGYSADKSIGYRDRLEAEERNEALAAAERERASQQKSQAPSREHSTVEISSQNK